MPITVTETCEFFQDILDGRVLTEADYESVGPVGESYYGAPIAWIDWTKVERRYCGKRAPIRIAGETDSWGTEWIYSCHEHQDSFND